MRFRCKDTQLWLLGRQERFKEGPWLYVVQAGEFVKIGKALSPMLRRVQLQVGSPHEIKMLISVPFIVYNERRAHERFAHIRHRGEWFHFNAEIRAFIAELRHRMRLERAAQRRIEKILKKWDRPKLRLDKLNTAVLVRFGRYGANHRW